MADLDWNRVHLGDEIGAEGQVCEIHERDDGLTVFVIRDAKLVKHRPRPRFYTNLYTVATAAATWTSSIIHLSTPTKDADQ